MPGAWPAPSADTADDEQLIEATGANVGIVNHDTEVETENPILTIVLIALPMWHRD